MREERKRRKCCKSSLILIAKSRKLKRGLIVAISVLLLGVVSFFVDLGGLGRAESTLLCLRVGCSRVWRRREYLRRRSSVVWHWLQSLMLSLLRVVHHRIAGQVHVAETLAGGER